jgi:D-alanine-D-alanine ligase
MKRKLKILALLHETLVPDESVKSEVAEAAEWKMEYHVIKALKSLGHEVILAPLSDDLSPIRRLNFEHKPDIAFNMLEEFNGEAVYDANVVSYLELIDLPYTGCNPRGLILSRDKALTKKILSYHRIPVPKFAVAKKKRKFARKDLHFPLFVKSLNEEASLGIAQASLVHDEKSLQDRIQFIHDTVKTDAIVEEFIEGRELYVSILGNERIKIFPPTELVFSKSKDPNSEFATRKVKWDESYRAKNGIFSQVAEGIDAETLKRIDQVCKRTYKHLQLSSYARIDLRLNSKGVPYVIEANPNPALSPDDEFALAADKTGMDYKKLIKQILQLALDSK